MDITVLMVSDGRSPLCGGNKRNSKRPATALLVLWGSVISFSAMPSMADWRVTPNLSLAETYTSNVTLSANNKQEEYITTLSPGVDIHAQGGRARLDLNYTLENLYYARESGRNNTYQQLQSKGGAELVRDWLSLEGNASISQTIIDPNKGLTVDNLNVTNNRGDVVTTELVPILHRTIGTTAEAELRFSHRTINYGGNNPNASDAVTDTTSAKLSNGRYATHLLWGLSYNQIRDNREIGADSDRKSSEGHLQYHPRRWISVVGYAGREAGTIATQQKFQEGSYWSAGVIWEPTPRWLFEATSGDNERRGRIEWTPTQRTTLKANYLKREVGIHPGDTWNATFNHRTRRSQWELTHTEEITSDLAQIFKETQTFQFFDQNNNPVLDAQGKPITVSRNVYQITDEEFERNYTQLKTSLNTGKTQLSVAGFHENRKYQLTPRSESVNGGTLGVDWKVASRSNLKLSHSAVLRNNEQTGTRETRISDIALHRAITPHASTWLDFRHAKEEAGNNSNEYQENRLGLHLAVTF